LNYRDDELEEIDKLNGDGEAPLQCAAISRVAASRTR